MSRKLDKFLVHCAGASDQARHNKEIMTRADPQMTKRGVIAGRQAGEAGWTREEAEEE